MPCAMAASFMGIRRFKEFNNGVFFYGETGTLFASDEKLIITPAGRGEQEVMDIPTPEMQDNHVAGFVNAVLAKDKNLLDCTIEDAFQSTATVQLAMASYYTNAPLHWDSTKKEITNNKEAAILLERPYRNGYKRPQV